MIFAFIFRLLFSLSIIYIARFLYLFFLKKLNYPKNYYPKTILITLGSGGHTGEMLFILK